MNPREVCPHMVILELTGSRPLNIWKCGSSMVYCVDGRKWKCLECGLCYIPFLEEVQRGR